MQSEVKRDTLMIISFAVFRLRLYMTIAVFFVSLVVWPSLQ